MSQNTKFAQICVVYDTQSILISEIKKKWKKPQEEQQGRDPYPRTDGQTCKNYKMTAWKIRRLLSNSWPPSTAGNTRTVYKYLNTTWTIALTSPDPDHMSGVNGLYVTLAAGWEIQKEKHFMT